MRIECLSVSGGVHGLIVPLLGLHRSRDAGGRAAGRRLGEQQLVQGHRDVLQGVRDRDETDVATQVRNHHTLKTLQPWIESCPRRRPFPITTASTIFT